MNISIVSVFAELYEPFVKTSLMKRAIEKGIISIDLDNFFSFVQPKERIDAPIFGHGPGMLLRPAVVERAVLAKESTYGKAYKIFFSPQGKKLDQCLVQKIAQEAQACGHLMLLPARYEGMDARVEETYADQIVSAGDFVLMGGDAAALMLLEAVLRFVPGVVGKEESVAEESFSGPFVEYSQFTEPVVWQGKEVPPFVRSGNHGMIDNERLKESAKKTVLGHFEWLRSYPLTDQEREVAGAYMPPHYCALMHCDVLVGEQRLPGTTSVTSIDIHDVARASSTYGVRQFFVVTPLIDQQKIVQRFLDFWMHEGISYNIQRHEAVRLAMVAESLDKVVATIEEREGKKPIIIATSAREIDHPGLINFNEQTRVWAENRPILFIFGTGRGFTEEILAKADFLLKPIKALTDYNHLSVRAAVAIVLDRWLGLNEKKC